MDLNLHTLLQIQPASMKETKGVDSLGLLNEKTSALPSDFEALLQMVNSGKLSEEDVSQVFNSIQEGDTKKLNSLMKELETKVSLDSPKVENAKTLQPEIKPELKNILNETKLISSEPKTELPTELKKLVSESGQKDVLTSKLIQNNKPVLDKEILRPETTSLKASENMKSVKAEAQVLKNNELLDFNQFMNKQSPVVQKRMAMHSYGNHQERKLFEQKFDAKVDTTVLARPQEKEMSVVSQEAKGDLAQNLMQNSEQHRHAQVVRTEAQPMIFDMNKLTSTTDTQKVIDQIQSYIVQTRAGSEQKVEMSFNHHDLGKVDLMVEKMGKDALNIRIQTHGNEGASFFHKHQGELLQTLNNSGIQVAHLKLESAPSNNANNQQFAQHRSDQGHDGQPGHSASQDQQRQDSERRAELWKLLSEREAA